MTSSERKNTKNIKIATRDGFVDFVGMRKTTHNSYLEITFVDGSSIKCSHLHLFLVDGMWCTAGDLEPFMALTGLNGDVIIFSIITKNETIDLYDIIGSGNHTYLSNGVISHNCAFISDKGTLINSITLEQIPFINPVREFGDLRVFCDSFAGRKIAMSCDVSEGIGQDSHAIQLFDIDTFEQIGEFQNNYLTQSMYTKEIIKILKLLFGEGAVEVYYTVEANSIGQGVMRLIENSSDPVFDRAQLISDIDSNRLGMLTTSKSKLSGCADLKDAVELNKLKINSERLVTELKFFIRKGSSFAAEPGMHDDLVMATVLMMNLLKVLANYEDNVYEMVNELQDLNEDDEVWGIVF